MKALVPLDGSPVSLGIFATVRRLLEIQPAFEVHLMTVLDPKGVKGSSEHVITEAPAAAVGKINITTPLPRLVESHGEAMDRQAGDARNWLQDLGHKEVPAAAVTVHAVWSEHPDQAINELAAKLEADVIVMATHGRSGISHLVAGSVTEGVIRHASRPVLVQGPGSV